MLAAFIILFVATIGVTRFAAGRFEEARKRGARERAPMARTGSDIARMFLASEGIEDVTVVEHNGVVTDYFDLRRRRLFLRPEVANGESMIAWAIALHEAAHASQVESSKGDLLWRQTCIRLSRYGPVFLGVGLTIAAFLKVMPVRVALIGFVVVMAIFAALNFGTLALEFNANTRVRRFLERHLDLKAGAREKLESLLPGVAMKEAGDLLKSPRYFFFSALPGSTKVRPQ